MTNTSDTMLVAYTTTQVGNQTLRKITEIFKDYLIKVITYYEENGIKPDSYQKNLFKLELNSGLSVLPFTCKKWIKKAFHLSCEHYFNRPLSSLSYNNLRIVLPEDDFLVSKGSPCIFIFSDINVTLSINVNLENISIKNLSIVNNKLELEVEKHH